MVIVMFALVAGVAVYWLQEYAYYHEAAFTPGTEILLTPIESDSPEPILAEGITGIDADSSPLRFRACFHTPLTQGMLTETYRAYDGAEPLNAPSWFDCFDAAQIGAALETGEAIAFLGQADEHYPEFAERYRGLCAALADGPLRIATWNVGLERPGPGLLLRDIDRGDDPQVAAIRRLGWPGSHAQRVARAVAVLRADFAQPLPVESLAALAGMSPSSFHQHFRAVTSLSPLQFQKQLRLIEARRLMLSEGVSASIAAFAVGYESVPQFTREYGRLFGLPPVRDTQAARDRTRAVG